MKSGKSVEVINCLRRDLGKPNFYWAKDSKFIIVEDCSDSFRESSIKIVNLNSFETEAHFTGLIGNTDSTRQQYDEENEILLYFSGTNEKNDFMSLYSYNHRKGKWARIYDLETRIEMEFPVIKRSGNKRELTIEYTDQVSEKAITKALKY